MPRSLYFQVVSKKYLKGIAEKATENQNFLGNRFHTSPQSSK